MDSNALKNLYHQAMQSPDRGKVVQGRLASLTQDELNQLFDSAVENDNAELGRLVERLLLPFIQESLGKQMTQALARCPECD